MLFLSEGEQQEHPKKLKANESYIRWGNYWSKFLGTGFICIWKCMDFLGIFSGEYNVLQMYLNILSK